VATEVTCIVDTDGTQSPDYTSLAAAIAGETGASPKCVTGADLVTNQEIAVFECRASSGVADGYFVLNGFTSSADYYPMIYVPEAYSSGGVWKSNAYTVDRVVSSGYNRVAVIEDPHAVIDGLQISGSGSATELIGIYNNSGTNDGRVLIRNCLIDINLTSGTGMGIYSRYDSEIVNCIVLRSNSGMVFQGYYTSTSVIYNCVIQGCTTGIYRYGDYTLSVTNCAVFNNADDFSGTMAVTYTASDDNDISGTGNIDISPGATEADDWAAAFTDYTNGDFSLKSGSPLIDAGIDLSAVMDSVDIIGTSRPQGDYWDIGAFEYVVSGGTLSIPVAMHHYNLLRSA